MSIAPVKKNLVHLKGVGSELKSVLLWISWDKHGPTKVNSLKKNCLNFQTKLGMEILALKKITTFEIIVGLKYKTYNGGI